MRRRALPLALLRCLPFLSLIHPCARAPPLLAGASFIQSLTLRLIEHLDAPLPAADADGADDGSPAGKEFLNLLALIAELYNFQVTSSVLIFDLVRRFLEGDGLKDERSVEGLLRIVRSEFCPPPCPSLAFVHQYDG